MRFLFVLVVALLIPTLGFAAETATKKKSKKASTQDRGLAVVEKNRDGRKRVALVIGNSTYASSPLKNPANDAKVMASTLRKLGFEVDERINLGYIPFNEAVENFGKKLSTGGIGLFYYAGHGMQVNGNNYLIPTDAKIDSENEVKYKAVDAGLVLAKMEQAKSDVNLVVLDACRDNPFSRSFRSAGKGLAFMDAPNGTFIAYATAPGKTAADGDGKNGLYTAELVKVLETPGIPVEQVFKRANKAVLERSSNKQSPWVASNLVGEFYFTEPSSMKDKQPSDYQPPSAKQLPSKPVIEEPVVSLSARAITDPTTGMEFVTVPAGCLEIVKKGFFTDDKRQACVSEYSIGKFEVTQGQWKAVMGSNPSHFSSCGDDCPVENVNRDDVQMFIQRLNSKSNRNYRLPTEVEWHFACTSGGKNEEYCGGNIVDVVAWHRDNSDSRTQQIGQNQPNGLGIYDMSGNVWEFVQDWFSNDYPSSQRNPQGASSGSYRVVRGGSWFDSPETARASLRTEFTPDARHNNLGFRLVSPAKKASSTDITQQSTSSPKSVETAPLPREDGETALWTEVQKGNSKEDYDAYLTQYPKGKYAALAKGRIKKLQDDSAIEAKRKEQEAWEVASNEGTEDGYRGYLKDWPKGRYVSLAQARLRKLQTELASLQKEKENKTKSVQNKSKAMLNKYLAGTWITAGGNHVKIYDGEGTITSVSELAKLYGFSTGDVSLKNCSYVENNKFICLIKHRLLRVSDRREEWIKTEVIAGTALLNIKFSGSLQFSSN